MRRKNSFDPRTDVPAPLQSYKLPIEVMMDRIARCGSGISRLGQCVDGALNCLREAIIHCFSKLKDIYHQSLKDAHTQSLKCDFSLCFSQLKDAVSACQTQMLQGGFNEISAYFNELRSFAI